MDDNNNSHNIALVDNTAPSQQVIEDRLSQTTSSGSISRHLSKRWTKDERARRKYRKWQPERLGIPDENSDSVTRQSPSPERNGSTIRGIHSQSENGLQEVDTVDFASGQGNGNGNGNESVNGNGNGNRNGNGNGNGNIRNGDMQSNRHIKPIRELDILYENQRGWFIFGIPLYSHGSLLNFDPSAWVTKDLKDSPVNITNAQLPDPSWEWAWQTWYVDMSGDVDEQGWQYSLSFSSSAWHGSHPWFHSFVRRRRWVRLRVKKATERARHARSRFEKGHMLTEDYFTIHPRSEGAAMDAGTSSIAQSSYLNHPSTMPEEAVATLEEIADIPTLMYAMKLAIVDREKEEAVKRFIADGGDELHYLDEKIPDIMATFIFQTSRWQFMTYLGGVVEELSEKIPQVTGDEVAEIQRKRDNLARAAKTARHHIHGPSVFGDENQASTGMLELSPVRREDSLLSKHGGVPINPIRRGKAIKGIPKEAEIGREGHIYRRT